MIQYDNKQNAMWLIFRRHGSVFPRTLIPALGSALLTFMLATEEQGAAGGENANVSWLIPFELPAIEHPFAVQIFAIVLGYVIVFRTNMALGRYRDGMTNVQLMTSKWGDAFMQLKAFAATEKATASPKQCEEIDEFMAKAIHWFTLLNALAMITLADEETDLHTFKYTKITPVQLVEDVDETVQPGQPGAPGADQQQTAKKTSKGRRKVFELGNNPLAVKGLPFRVVGHCSHQEQEQLDKVPDKLLCVAAWITEGVTRMSVTQKLSIPGPILSRFYQEMSNGMLGFNQAFKVTFVPFPFPFAQILAALLSLFCLICPIMVVQMTRGRFVPPMLCFVAIFGYWNLNMIAVELENPFGDDPNDLPLIETHSCFVDALEEAFSAPPRPVNQRRIVEKSKQLCPWIEKLNFELEKMEEPERFSEVLVVECLELWTREDFEKKFRIKTTAHTVHKMVRKMLDDKKSRPGALPDDPDTAGGRNSKGGAHWTQLRVAAQFGGAMAAVVPAGPTGNSPMPTHPALAGLAAA
jgi:predicted membrane chloride channel (bestrophin family)